MENLCTSIELMISEGKHVSKSDKFPIKRLQEILEQLLLTSSRTSDLVSCLEEFTNCIDIIYHSWNILRDIMFSLKENKSEDTLVLNILDLLEKIPPSKVFTKKSLAEGKVSSDEAPCFLQGVEFSFEVINLRKCMSNVWQRLINRTITPSVHRKLLIVLLESYLSHLHKPLFLTDFFMYSMNYGGAISLLGLQGMSILMQKHNIEYPNIYGKLYTMFEPEILHTKYKSRLFYLADIFLSSTYLPESLIAAFVKRASRLALTSEISDIIMILRFVENILIRNSGLKKLIHNPLICEVDSDPFIMEEQDPYKSRAIESSLWEISLLKNHVQPRVSSAAKFIDCNLKSMETDMNEVLDTTSEHIFEVETKKKTKSSLTYVRPTSVTTLKDNRLYKLWSLT